MCQPGVRQEWIRWLRCVMSRASLQLALILHVGEFKLMVELHALRLELKNDLLFVGNGERPREKKTHGDGSVPSFKLDILCLNGNLTFGNQRRGVQKPGAQIVG